MVQFFKLAILKLKDLNELIDSNVQLTIDNEELKHELSVKISVIKTYEERINVMTAKLADMDLKLAGQQEAYKRAYNENYHIEEVNSRLTELTDNLKRENSSLNNKIHTLRDESKKLADTISRLRKSNSAAVRDLFEKNEMVDNLKQQVEELKAKIQHRKRPSKTDDKTE